MAYQTDDHPELQSRKYNGKEFVEMHGLDEYDSQARSYYPAIGRTPTLDPNSESYYSVSPYAWCGNNLVKFIDPDGKDYIVIIDPETGIVTIQATYYASSQDIASAQQAVEYWNNQSGKYTYETKEGNYSVQFSLTAEEVETTSMDSRQIGGALNTAFGQDKSGGANVYRVVPDARVTDSNTNGGAAENFIKVKESRRDTDTGAHEVGHTLGLMHSTTGIMISSSANRIPNSAVNTSGLKDMLKYPLKGKRNGSNGIQTGKGTVQYFKLFWDFKIQNPLLSSKGKMKKN